MTKNSLHSGLNKTGIDFLEIKNSSIFDDQEFKENIEEIITPIDDFINPQIQEYLEKNNYFQDVLDIVEDLKESGEDIEKNYHAIVGIGEMQDYFRNKDLQEKIVLVLDEVIKNLNNFKKTERKITEEEEKQLDHIERFINKRGLKKGEYSVLIKDKLQIIQNLSTKIVNNIKSKENENGYENKIEFGELFNGIENNKIKELLLEVRYIQLTKGCSWNCAGCSFLALNRKKLGTYLSWEAVTKIIDGLGKKDFHIFYFASDPLDWFDKDAGKKYSDISSYYYKKFNINPSITTKIPENINSLNSLKSIFGNEDLSKIRVSITEKNIERVIETIKKLNKKYGNEKIKKIEEKGKMSFVFNTNKGMKYIKGFGGFFEYIDFLQNDEEIKITDLTEPLGKKYNYESEKINNFNELDKSFKISPDGVNIYHKVSVSPLYPSGYLLSDITDNSDEKSYIYDALYFSSIYFSHTHLQLLIMDGKINIIKKYFNNNPSHKLFFKKKFEKLIDTDLYKKVPELFELFDFKKQ